MAGVNKLERFATNEIIKLRRRHKAALETVVSKLEEKYITGPDGEDAVLAALPDEDARIRVRDTIQKKLAEQAAKQQQLFDDPAQDEPVENLIS